MAISSKKLFVFDLDHTLISTNSSFAFCRYLIKEKILPKSKLLSTLWTYFQFKYLALSVDQVHHRSFKDILLGKEASLIGCMAIKYLESHLDQLIIPSILSYFLKAKEEGHHTLLLSSSPNFLVEPIAKKLQFNFWEGTAYSVDNNNCFCKIFRLVRGEEKASYVLDLARKLQISNENIVCFTDSHHDLPLLQLCGKPFAVFPDRKLKKISINNSWEIIER